MCLIFHVYYHKKHRHETQNPIRQKYNILILLYFLFICFIAVAMGIVVLLGSPLAKNALCIRGNAFWPCLNRQGANVGRLAFFASRQNGALIGMICRVIKNMTRPTTAGGIRDDIVFGRMSQDGE
jgi:hypothetical protein